jgi:ABC-2 type transport system ATP-binding protein
MHDPAVLVLDEPTSGLDPVMQEAFIEFIKAEKKRGKTILLSSHIFSEVDATCDKISIIKDGKLVSTFIADDLRHNKTKTFKIEFNSKDEFEKFQKNHSTLTEAQLPYELASVKEQRNQINIHIDDANINEFIEFISIYNLKFFSEIKFTLEDYFMSFYDKNRKTNTNMNGGKITNAIN